MLSADQAPGHFGQYEILEKLGEGGMGVVYKARDTRLNRPAAIKLLRPERLNDEKHLRRFQFEAHVASNLQHPNIVVIYDIACEGGVTYIAMEYVNGKTLAESIPRRGMRIAEVLKIAVQIAEGVGAAANAGLVHRDLKPSNVMVTEDGRVKVLDFGLAKTFGASDDGSTLAIGEHPQTGEGMMVGTVAYMSPEQAQGGVVDARSDIFSFGTILYEMVTGQRAFRGGSTASTITAILRDDPPPVSRIVPDVPYELETVINRCLRKDPERRFQTIADVRVSLLDLIDDTQSGRLRTRRDDKRQSAKSRKLWLGLAGVAAALALGWLGRLAFHAVPKEPPQPMRVLPFASYQGFEGYPAFSPDGNQVAFTWTGGSGEVTHIYVKVIGTDVPLPLTSGELSDNYAAFAPDSRSVAFLRTLANGQTGVYQVSPLGGPPRLISSVPSALYPSLAWSRDGRWLLTAGKPPGRDHSQLLAVSTTDGQSRTISLGSTKEEFGGALSPDSKRLAFVRTNTYSDWNLLVVPVDEKLQPTETPLQLAAPAGLNRQPAWTADGNDLIFANGGTSTTRLWRISARKYATAEQLSLSSEAVYQPAIARTGERLAFTHDFRNANIWKLTPNHDGKVEEMEIASSARSSYARPHAFSNGGTRIAFESNRNGSYALWTAPADGSGVATQLFSNGETNSGSPAWSPDDKWIAFDTRSNRFGQIFVISIDGGPPRAVSEGQSDNILPAWSRDGKWIYFDSNRTGTFEIFKCSPAGGAPIQVTHGGGWGAQESPDGQRLYYSRSRTIPSPLLVIPTGGGAESEVMPAVHERWWGVAQHGIWYMERLGKELDPGLWSMENVVSMRAELRFFDFETKRAKRMAVIPRAPAGSLALSPDGRNLLVSEVDHQGFEISLVEGFH